MGQRSAKLAIDAESLGIWVLWGNEEERGKGGGGEEFAADMGENKLKLHSTCFTVATTVSTQVLRDVHGYESSSKQTETGYKIQRITEDEKKTENALWFWG